MITIECPLCEGDATVAENVTALTCDGCDVSVEVALEPVVTLGMAA